MNAAPPPRLDRSDREYSLPDQLTGFTSPIMWGVLLLVAIEATLFALFVASYLYLWLGASEWPPPGVAAPDLLKPTMSQVLLLISPLPAWLGFRALTQGRPRPLLVGLPIGLLLAGGHLVLKAAEYASREYRWDAHAYGSLDWTMGGYSALHVIVLILAGAVVWALGLRGHFHRRRYTGVQAFLLYWIFVSVGSLMFYGVQYLAGRW
jgi:cytochrome c oxidase subunit III